MTRTWRWLGPVSAGAGALLASFLADYLALDFVPRLLLVAAVTGMSGSLGTALGRRLANQQTKPD